MSYVKPVLVLSKRRLDKQSESPWIETSLLTLKWRPDRIEWAAIIYNDSLFRVGSWDMVYHPETKRAYAIELVTNGIKYTINIYEINPFGLNDLSRDIERLDVKAMTASDSPFAVMPTAVYEGQVPKPKRPEEGSARENYVMNPKTTATENSLTIRFSRGDESEPIAVSYSFKTKKWSEKE